MKKYLLEIMDKTIPRSLVLFIDLAIVSVNFLLSKFILNEFSTNFDFITAFQQLPYILGISIVCFLIVGSYKGVIRHTGFRDTISIYVSVSLITFCILILKYLNQQYRFSDVLSFSITSIIFLFLLNIFVLISSRYLFKFVYGTIIAHDVNLLGQHVLIYGAGEMGSIVYSTLHKSHEKKIVVKGFIDDDPKKQGFKIDRLRVLSPFEVDKSFVISHKIEEVIIAIKGINKEKLVQISDVFLPLGVKVKMVPPIHSWVGGDLQANQIKQIKIEDLLNRVPIELNNVHISNEVYQKTILVTGAAGSIGSEIVNQLSQYKYQRLLLVDQSESALYDVEQNLLRKNIKNISCYVADVRDQVMMNYVFSINKPDLVFHAAAYKHVPLMESSPYEAVKINVLGTKNIADLSCQYHAEKFVMVSTDKAVNPTNVMGATKRVAELYIQIKNNTQTKTKFITTRFGNVLGSNGSVIPLFKRQIEEGGPITLTHPEITRYFMTIPEACQLVIEAGCMGSGGEIFIFDMGESVKIIDLAKRMIQLSGLKFPDDINIKITGLRPGEKLYEELLNDGENSLPTHHEKIMIHKSEAFDVEKKSNLITSLLEELHPEKSEKIVRKIKAIVPEYRSNNSVFENLDH